MFKFCEETNVNIQQFLSDLNSTWNISIDFIKTIPKFNEDPFRGSRIISCLQTDGQKDRADLVRAVHGCDRC
jgi:hypothetical protein